MEISGVLWEFGFTLLLVISTLIKDASSYDGPAAPSPSPVSAPLTSLSDDKLGPMNVFQDSITLSGFSSGGTMAQMFQISYSSLFRGIAVFSHTYYRCGPAAGDIDEYDRFCTSLQNLTNSEVYNTSLVHEDIREYLSMGIIEDPSNLKDTKLYVYTGLRNVLFSPRQALNILQVYEPYIQSAASIKVRVQDSVQVLPSNTYGGQCNDSSVEETDFIGNCGFSGVTEAINFILFDKQDNEAFEVLNTPRGNVTLFDQTEFTQGLADHNIDDMGYYYVPTKCRSGTEQCYLHFYFHGCLTGREFNGPSHVENSGLLELAERKNIIVIFPQAKSSITNPIGCWDTFGVAGRYYATQQGPQVTAMKRMVDRVLGTGSLPTTTVTSAEQSDSTRILSRVTVSRSSPQYAFAQKLKALTNNRNSQKLTYLPPPPSLTATPAPLRRSAYKAVVRRP